jgi:hypothetical protein
MQSSIVGILVSLCPSSHPPHALTLTHSQVTPFTSPTHTLHIPSSLPFPHPPYHRSSYHQPQTLIKYNKTDTIADQTVENFQHEKANERGFEKRKANSLSARTPSNSIPMRTVPPACLPLINAIPLHRCPYVQFLRHPFISKEGEKTTNAIHYTPQKNCFENS